MLPVILRNSEYLSRCTVKCFPANELDREALHSVHLTSALDQKHMRPSKYSFV